MKALDRIKEIDKRYSGAAFSTLPSSVVVSFSMYRDSMEIEVIPKEDFEFILKAFKIAWEMMLEANPREDNAWDHPDQEFEERMKQKEDTNELV